MRNLLVAAMLLATPASAYTLKYKVAKPDAAAILARVEAATGLNFSAKCETAVVTTLLMFPPKDGGSTCIEGHAIHGHVNTSPGSVVVEVYQAKTADKRVAPVKVTAEMKKKIGQAVLNR